jgi:hypothetical protein
MLVFFSGFACTMYTLNQCYCKFVFHMYRGADKSLARPTSRCILFDGENILFDASLVLYINSTNIPPILLLPLALQPTVGFGLSNNVPPFPPIYHQLSQSSHSQHLNISLYFLFPSFPWSFPSSRPFQLLSEDLFGHPILHSLQLT